MKDREPIANGPEAHPLSRRAFIAATAAVAASPSVMAAPSQPPPGKPFKLAVKLGMVAGGLTLREKFTLLKDIGFDGVELDSPNSFDSQEVLDARDGSGLPIHGVVDSAHWRDTLSHPDPETRRRGVDALETALRDCHAYGGSTVLLVPAVVTKEVSYEDAYRRSQAEIRRVLPLAEELGITIAFENVWNHFLLSALEAARYVDELESDYARWYFDVGNIVNFGWPEHWIRTLGPRIVKLDIKDFSRAKRDQEGLWKGFNVSIGEGDSDWPAVRAALREIGYSGWATAEVGGGDRARLDDILVRMRKVLGFAER